VSGFAGGEAAGDDETRMVVITATARSKLRTRCGRERVIAPS
jgi:hypothetical protein